MVKRAGSKERRQLEFLVVRDQVMRRKAEFIARLQRHLRRRGRCLLFKGALSDGGYVRMNFRYKGEHVQIHAHRVFMILMTCAPIPLQFEAGHTPECKHRTCILHLQLEHYADNACTKADKNRPGRKHKHTDDRRTAA